MLPCINGKARSQGLRLLRASLGPASPFPKKEVEPLANSSSAFADPTLRSRWPLSWCGPDLRSSGRCLFDVALERQSHWTEKPYERPVTIAMTASLIGRCSNVLESPTAVIETMLFKKRTE